LSIIAEKIDINPCHLSRQFKKETKMTITDFINERRIEEAKFLIEQNNNSITEIALMVGYENHNYFCKVFKRITSLTPMDYLKKTQLKNRKSGYPPFLNVRY
jgi:YesN/AraC family two-component response regulator